MIRNTNTDTNTGVSVGVSVGVGVCLKSATAYIIQHLGRIEENTNVKIMIYLYTFCAFVQLSKRTCIMECISLVHRSGIIK